MDIEKKDLLWAASKGLVSVEQAHALWTAFTEREQESDVPSFNPIHLLYYAGALLILASMGWFLFSQWDNLDPRWLVGISSIYALLFLFLGTILWRKKDFKIVGGVFFTVAVGMVPLIIYGLERAYWPGAQEGDSIFPIQGILINLGTIIAALGVLYFIRFPFLIAPLALSVWFLVYNLFRLYSINFPVGDNSESWVYLVTGVVMILGAYWLDRHSNKDFAFWFYVVGALSFWLSLTFLFLFDGGRHLEKFIYAVVNMGLLVISILLNRKIFLVLGALGLFGYFFYLAGEVFADSIFFPFAVSLLGLAVIFLGIQYQRRQDKINATILGWLPASWRSQLPH